MEKTGAGAAGCDLLAEDALPYVAVFGMHEPDVALALVQP